MARSTRRQVSPQETESGNSPEDLNLPAATSSSRNPTLGDDQEVQEKPVREKLKKTSIANTTQDDYGDKDLTTDQTVEVPGANVDSDDSFKENGRGRIQKKRSFEDFDEDQTGEHQGKKIERHARKKSRDYDADMSSESSSRKISGEHTFHKIDEAHDDDTVLVDRVDDKDTTKGSGHPQPLALARPSTPSEGQVMKDEDMVTSPKNKRNRDEFLLDEKLNVESAEKSHEMDVKDSSAVNNEQDATKTNGDERNPKRARDSPKAQSPAPEDSVKGLASTTKSGFGNSSATSPFSVLSGRKSAAPTAHTSASAFAPSGFGSLVASTTSGFGSNQTKSNFTSTTENKPSGFSSSGNMGGFGSLGSEIKPSFASTKNPTNGPPASGFGSLQKGAGGSFGSGFGGAAGPRLSSFASGDGGKITGLSDKAAKPFGAAMENEESEEGSADDEREAGERLKSPPLEEERKDKRFYEQDMETGEEGETTVFSCRAKLYNFDTQKREWKERGVGVIKVNVRDKTLEDLEKEGSTRARFVMRADGSHRVVLNSPINRGIKVEAPGKPGEKPTGGLLAFLGSIDGKAQLESLQLRLKPVNAEQLWQRVVDLQEEME